MPRHARGFDTEQAWDHLSRRDRKLGTWMKRIGYIEPQPGWRKPFDPVDALARAILYQQLSGKAAATTTGSSLQHHACRSGRLCPLGRR